MYTVHLQLIGKLVVDFLFVIIKLFSLIFYGGAVISGNLSKSAFFEGRCQFQMEGASPTNHCWCQKTKVIALSCDTKISAVHCLVFVTKHACDRQTDRQMDREMDKQNYDSQDYARTAVSHDRSEIRK